MEQQAQNDAGLRIAEEAEASAHFEQLPHMVSQEQQQIEHSEFEGAVAQIQQGLDAKVEEVRQDRRLSKDEQHQQISDLWQRASEFHTNMYGAYEKILEERSAEQERAVFHVIPSNRDSVRSAYNDVYDRTEWGFSSGEAEGLAYASEELERIWERAVRTGDRALQTAVGHIATERGIEGLRDAWLETSQEKTKAWGRYVDARTKLDDWRDPQQRMWGNLTRKWTLRKPEEA